MPDTADVLVVGAGVIGMATALELVDRGLRVCIFDRGRPGGESSWAGAGIIYPAFLDHARDPFERLRAVSYAAWPTFAERLGEDVGLLQCGGLLLEPTQAELDRVADDHRRAGATVEHCDPHELEPNLAAADTPACLIPEICQVRNPWLVRALARRLEERGATFVIGKAVRRVLGEGDRAIGLETTSGERFHGSAVLLAAGAWSSQLLSKPLDIQPVRGQIVLFRPRRPLLRHIVDAGKHYLVPRGDRRILAGSTEEHVGFQKGVTGEAFAELYSFASAMLPALADAEVEATWSGLRPGTPTGTPYLFEDADLRRLWVAAGHFRLGLQLARGTALLLADWITGSAGFASPRDFGPDADRASYRRSFTA